jgi:hypothetical protein
MVNKFLYSKRFIGVLFVASSTVLITILTLIDPTGRPVIYTFLPIIVTWVVLITLIQLIFLFFLTGKPKRLFMILNILAVSIGMLMFLMSGLGQLTGRDVLLSISLVVICTFYFYRSWS